MILISSLKWSSLFITTYTSFASRRGATKTEFHFGCTPQLRALANWEHSFPMYQLVQMKSMTVDYLQNVDLFRKPQCIFWKNSTFCQYYICLNVNAALFLHIHNFGLRKNATSHQTQLQNVLILSVRRPSMLLIIDWCDVRMRFDFLFAFHQKEAAPNILIIHNFAISYH